MQMQEWLQDKKNQPKIIALLVVVLLIVGGVIFWQMKGDSSSQSADTSAAMAPMAPGAPTPPMPGGAPATAPPPGTVGTPGIPAPDAGGGAPPTPGGPAVAQSPSGPTPAELWRDDPFALPGVKKKQNIVVVRRIDLPSLGRLFPPPAPKAEEVSEKLIPQPQRRLAGILYGERVNALIQTGSNEWETVQPGQKLHDGTIVERIERDRVILRTADSRPRIIVVKLASSFTPVQDQSATGGTSTTGPPNLPGVPPGFVPIPGMPGMGRRAM